MILGEVLLSDTKSKVTVELEELAFKAMLENNMQSIVDSVAQ